MSSLTRRIPHRFVPPSVAALALALTLAAPAPLVGNGLLEDCLEAGGTYTRTCSEYKIAFGLVAVKTCTETCEISDGQ